jgi:choline dehydrogenase
VTKTELLPGIDANDVAEVEEHIRREAWGHHACGTARSAARRPDGGARRRLRVRGTKGRASWTRPCFRASGFFIVTSIYMVSEKASDVIIAAARAADA